MRHDARFGHNFSVHLKPGPARPPVQVATTTRVREDVGQPKSTARPLFNPTYLRSLSRLLMGTEALKAISVNGIVR